MSPDEARRRLEAERERLLGVRASLAGDRPADAGELSEVDQHPADVATEVFGEEADQGLADELDAELGDVEHALRRLDDGTYGTCEACGRPIGDERLEALPWTRFCVDDAARAEDEALRGG